jgi:hypothetical protein
MNNTAFTITPLGAAVVDALPDQRKVKAITLAFRRQKVCPTSRCFTTPESVMEFYSSRGERIRSHVATSISNVA